MITASRCNAYANYESRLDVNERKDCVQYGFTSVFDRKQAEGYVSTIVDTLETATLLSFRIKRLEQEMLTLT